MQIITVLLSIVSVIGFLWAIVGTPIGIILVIIYFVEKDKTKKTNFKKWIKISFSGLALLLISFILYAIVNLIATLVGIPTNVVPKGL